jgi:hypothetical protein
LIYTWVLVIWVGTFDNFTIHDKFENIEQCLDNQARLTRALKQVESKMKSVCRPIAK